MKVETFIVDYLGFCGCYDEEVIDDIINVFKIFYKEGSHYYTDIAEELELPLKYVHLILNILDSKGWLEHGTSVRGSWITKEGLLVLDGLTNY